MVTYKAALPEWFDSTFIRTSRSCSNEGSATEAKAGFLQGISLSHPLWLQVMNTPRTVKVAPTAWYVNTREEQHIFLPHSTGWAIF